MLGENTRPQDTGVQRHYWPAVLIACLLFACAAGWLYTRADRRRDYDIDESIYTYVGWSWGQGRLPYRDAWDHKGPVVYVVTRARTALYGTAIAGLRHQEIIGATLVAIVVALIALLLWGRREAVLAFAAATLLWATFRPGFGHISTPGVLVALFSSVSVLAAIRATQCGRRSALACVLISGGAFGLVISTRLNAWGAMLPAGIALLAARQTNRLQPSSKPRPLLIWILGAVLAPFFFLLMFRQANGLREMLDAYVAYNVLRGRYLAGGAGLLQSIVFTGWRTLQIGALPLICSLGVTVLAVSVRGRRSRNPVFEWQAWIVLPWLLAELMLIASSGGQIYHVYPLVPPLVLSGVWLVRQATQAASRQRRWLAAGAVLVLLAPSLAGAVTTLTHMGDTSDRSRWDVLLNTIHSATSPDEPLFVMGWDGPRLLALAQRQNASRYIYPTPLYTRGYASGERWMALLEELKSSGPPRLLALDVGGLPPPVNGEPTVEWALEWFEQGNIPTRLQDRTPYLERNSLKQYIFEHYRMFECQDETLCLLVHAR